MKKTIVRTWSGNGKDEFRKALDTVWMLFTRTQYKDKNIVYDRKYMFRYISFEIKDIFDRRCVESAWNNETGNEDELDELYTRSLYNFSIGNFGSFYISIELVKE